MDTMECSELRAVRAIRAAKNRRVWGRWATMRYLARHGVSVSVRLYQIAVACEAEGCGDYCEATTDMERLRIRRNMEEQTRTLMHQMLQAGLLAGAVTAK